MAQRTEATRRLPGAGWTRLLVGLLLAGAWFWPGRAASAPPAAAPESQDAEVFLSVHGRSRVLSLVVVPFADQTGAAVDRSLAAAVFGIVRDDLTNCLRFDVQVDSAGPDTSGWGARIGRWSASGARALVRGVLRPSAAGEEVFATVYRLPDARVLLNKAYPVQPPAGREAAHRLSDDIVYALTGERGIARTRIAFASRWQGHREVFVMDWDGHDPGPVTDDRAVALSPSWSPDGSRLVYSSLQHGAWGLRLLDLATGSATPLLTPSAMNTAPAWSPDGQSVLFAMNQGGDIDLYTASVPDGRLQRITQHPETDTEPDWSADGQQIAFVSDRTGLPQVYLARRNGSQLRRLTWEPDAYEGSPAWSPDGTRIAFVRRGFDGFDVYVAEIGGGAPLRLTEGDSNENPVWSPDGLLLAFCRTRGDGSDIWVMAADGSQARRLTTDGSSVLPSWSPRPPDVD